MSLELVLMLEVIIVRLIVLLLRIHILRGKCLLLSKESRWMSREITLNMLIISVWCSYICASANIPSIALVLRPEFLNIF